MNKIEMVWQLARQTAEQGKNMMEEEKQFRNWLIMALESIKKEEGNTQANQKGMRSGVLGWEFQVKLN